MATSASVPASVELFYSYAHSDEPLCRELQKHLTALKRSGLISDWYDRKIEPGSEWAREIHEAMERAGIILLLVSADFLASNYIFNTELPFALQRHDAGRAIVIPILLRPVEWRDLPFAKLQVLPSQARPVTSWPNHDEAFSDVAGRLRELLYQHRLRGLQTTEPQPALTAAQERVVDAAIASSVIVDEPTDLVTMIRTTASAGLKAILRLDRTYSPTSEDVSSKTFELDFPSDAAGRPLPVNLGLSLESPGFDPPQQQKKIRVPSTGDSDVLVFMLTPKRAGKVKLNLQVLLDDVVIGSRVLVTTAVPPASAQRETSYGVISVPLLAPPKRPPVQSAMPILPIRPPAESVRPILPIRPVGKLCSNGMHIVDPSWTECPYCRSLGPAEPGPVRQPTAVEPPPPSPRRRTTAFRSEEPQALPLGTASAKPIRKIVGILITFTWHSEGQLFPLFEGRNLIGSDPDCDVRIAEDQTMSGRNTSIVFRKSFVVSDLASMNGTYLNNVPVEEEFETLGNYASLRVGSTDFTFVMINPPEQ